MKLRKIDSTLVNTYRFVIYNGCFEAKISDSLPEGLSLDKIEQGFQLQLSSNVVLKKPVMVTYVNEYDQAVDKKLNIKIKIEKNAQMELIEEYISHSNQAVNVKVDTEIHLEEEARLKHSKIILENDVSQHHANLSVVQEKRSEFKSLCLSLLALHSSHHVKVRLLEPKASCALSGLYLGVDKNQVEQHMLVEHLAQDTQSYSVFKGILNDHSKAVFDGRIHVAKEAQRTDAKLKNKNILLSEEAELVTKPELEILADDVKCAHGATVGHLDEATLFYLQSRGLAISKARQVLLLAFVNDVIDGSATTALSEHLQQYCQFVLAGRHV